MTSRALVFAMRPYSRMSRLNGWNVGIRLMPHKLLVCDVTTGRPDGSPYSEAKQYPVSIGKRIRWPSIVAGLMQSMSDRPSIEDSFSSVK